MNINLKQWHDIFEAIESIVDKYCERSSEDTDCEMLESANTQVSPMMENIQYNHELDCLVVPTWEAFDIGPVEPGWITVGAEEVEEEFKKMGDG